jgi:hypothetical protein
MATMSGWVLTMPARRAERQEVDSDLARRFLWLSRCINTTVWGELAHENIVRDIAALGDNWDAAGAHAIGERAVRNARAILRALSEYGYPPDLIYPNPAATIEFEWEQPSGSARLEVGNSTFAFYTVPNSGNSIMLDGVVQEALDVEQICFALASIYSNNVARSLVAWSKPLGLENRHSRRAA